MRRLEVCWRCGWEWMVRSKRKVVRCPRRACRAVVREVEA